MALRALRTLVGPFSGQLLAKVADLRPAEVHLGDLAVHDQYLDRPGRSERCCANFRHAVQEVVAACQDLEPPGGRSTKRKVPVALTVTVLLGSLRLVTVIRKPGEGAMPENWGLLGRSTNPTLPSETTSIANGQASPAAKVSVDETGVGGAPAADAPGVSGAVRVTAAPTATIPTATCRTFMMLPFVCCLLPYPLLLLREERKPPHPL